MSAQKVVNSTGTQTLDEVRGDVNFGTIAISKLSPSCEQKTAFFFPSEGKDSPKERKRSIESQQNNLQSKEAARVRTLLFVAFN